MKFIHLADLHLGKKLHGENLIEDQKHVLNQITDHILRIRPDAVLIAGDVYDKMIPSTEAVQLFDSFLTSLIAAEIKICMIGGNHDSQERLSFVNSILLHQGLFISSAYDGHMEKITIKDEHGDVNIWMLPHIFPREVARFFGGIKIQTTDDAIRAAIDCENIDPKARNILMAHQFVTGLGENPITSESEILNVGGLDAVDYHVFGAFNYVALGHLHGAQRIGRDAIRYAGSPLKYSFSEARQKKTFVLGEIGADGQASVELVPIELLHGMRELKGELDNLLKPEIYEQGDVGDYIRVTLTDVQQPVAPLDRLGTVYKHVLSLEFAKAALKECGDEQTYATEEKSPVDLFSDFYQKMTGKPMNAIMSAYIRDAADEVWKEAE